MPLFRKKPHVENIEEFRDIADDVIESDFVPFACHWNDNTIVTKNGEALQIIKITEDVSLGEADDADLRATIRESVLAAIDTTEYSVWIHTVRRKANFQAAGDYKRDFAGYLDRFWKDRNDWQHKFVNEVYITILCEGQGASLKSSVSFVRQIIPRFDVRHRERYLDNACAKLTRITDDIIRGLSIFGARKLGLYYGKDDVWYSEPISFLSKLASFQDAHLPVQQMSIADQITDYDVTFGYSAMEIRMRNDGRRRFGAYLTIKECREIPPEPLDVVLKLPFEFIISQSFVFADTEEALKGYNYQKKLFSTSNSSVLAARSGLKEILASNTGRSTDYCNYQLGVMLVADSVKSLEGSVAKAVVALGKLGLAPMREDVALEESYWSILPGNFQCTKRLKPLNTSAMWGFANLTCSPYGKLSENHWGDAVATFNTIARVPYVFNFHSGDNGHTILAGPLGGGKTVLMNFLLAQSRKYDGKLFYFDRERRGETFIRSIDGVYFNLCPGSDSRPYMQLKLNPLQLEDTQQNREFLERWLLFLAGAAANADLAASCKPVIAAIMQKPKAERQLAACATLLIESNSLWKGALSAWLVGGKYEHYFNNAEDTLGFENKVIGFEMDNLLQQKDALSPVFAYILHRVMQALDGKPSIVAMDEAWDLLSTPVLAPRVKSWLQALKDKNAIALLASDQIDEIKNSPLNKDICASVATKIFLPDDAADAGYAEAFDISLKDITYLQVMNNEDRHFLVIKAEESVVLELDLTGMVDIVSVLSATPYHLQVLEQAIAARGISPTQWMPKFLESI